jgi:hypothetical protein
MGKWRLRILLFQGECDKSEASVSLPFFLMDSHVHGSDASIVSELN